MAVYTDVSDEELEAFIASYAVGALTSFKGIAEGVENSNYLVHTESGRYILTLYEKRVRPEDLPYFLALMEHLASRARCPSRTARATRSSSWRAALRPSSPFSKAYGFGAPASSIVPDSAKRSPISILPAPISTCSGRTACRCPAGSRCSPRSAVGPTK
jgi:phosphotransferase family enzyme